MQGRGLKLIYGCGKKQKIKVAPHAGAWIETYNGTIYTAGKTVAPHAGAWIETPWQTLRR